MEAESQEVRWDECEWDGMVEKVFNMVTTSLPTDVTLVTEDGKRLEAHRLILKASSPTFRSILNKTNIGNSTTVASTLIYMPGFVHEQLVSVVEFIYLGKTKVVPNLLEPFMATINSLGMISSTNNKMGENTSNVALCAPEEGTKDKQGGRDNDIRETNENEETEDGEIIESNKCVSTQMENRGSFANNVIDNQFERCYKIGETNRKTPKNDEIRGNIKNLETFNHTIISVLESANTDAKSRSFNAFPSLPSFEHPDNKIESDFENPIEDQTDQPENVNNFLEIELNFDPKHPVDPGPDLVTPKQEFLDEDIGPLLEPVIDPVIEAVQNVQEIESAMIRLRELSHETGENLEIGSNPGDSESSFEAPITNKKKKKDQKRKKKEKVSEGSKKVIKPRGEIVDVTCEICGKHFRLLPHRKNNKYNTHMKRHKIKDQDCGCDMIFKIFEQKHKHMRVVHQGYFNCTLCPRNSQSSFSTEKFFNEHKELKHSEKSLPYKETFTCNKCRRTFEKKASMIYHVETRHNEEGPFVCDHCGKTMLTRSVLRMHEKRVHNPKPCPICSKVVKNMRIHNLTTHTDNSMLKVKCETCGRGFKDTPSLKSHEMSLHIKTRPFKCRYKCPNDIGYNDLSNRNSHEKKKHGGLFS